MILLIIIIPSITETHPLQNETCQQKNDPGLVWFTLSVSHHRFPLKTFKKNAKTKTLARQPSRWSSTSMKYYEKNHDGCKKKTTKKCALIHIVDVPNVGMWHKPEISGHSASLCRQRLLLTDSPTWNMTSCAAIETGMVRRYDLRASRGGLWSHLSFETIWSW